jgi:hypothetical protein
MLKNNIFTCQNIWKSKIFSNFDVTSTETVEGHYQPRSKSGAKVMQKH